MKYIIILFSFFILFASCERTEPKIVGAEKQNFIIFNEAITLLPILASDGFVVLTTKDSKQLMNKIDFDGNRVWQKDITSVFDFTTKLEISYTKMFKTEDQGFLIVLAHQDSEKYGNLRFYVKYLKIDKDGNVVYNFDKIIIDENPNNGDESYSCFDTYESKNGEIVNIAHKYEYDDISYERVGILQLTRYATSGELVSNKKIVFYNIYEFWEILSFSDNTIFVVAEAYGTSEFSGMPTLYQFTENGQIETIATYQIDGFLTHSGKTNDDFILCFAGYTTQGNQLIEIDRLGNIVRQVSLNRKNKQFISYSSLTVNGSIYFAGLTTNNIFEMTRPQMAWAKLSGSEFLYLGELKAMEETAGLVLNINSDNSISILGKKKSFGADNMILLKTKTDGTIITD